MIFSGFWVCPEVSFQNETHVPSTYQKHLFMEDIQRYLYQMPPLKWLLSIQRSSTCILNSSLTAKPFTFSWVQSPNRGNSFQLLVFIMSLFQSLLHVRAIVRAEHWLAGICISFAIYPSSLFTMTDQYTILYNADSVPVCFNVLLCSTLTGKQDPEILANLPLGQ